MQQSRISHEQSGKKWYMNASKLFSTFNNTALIFKPTTAYRFLARGHGISRSISWQLSTRQSRRPWREWFDLRHNELRILSDLDGSWKNTRQGVRTSTDRSVHGQNNDEYCINTVFVNNAFVARHSRHWRLRIEFENRIERCKTKTKQKKQANKVIPTVGSSGPTRQTVNWRPSECFILVKWRAALEPIKPAPTTRTSYDGSSWRPDMFADTTS